MKISWVTPNALVDVDLPIIANLQKNTIIYWQIVIFGHLNKDVQQYVEANVVDGANIKYEYVEIPYRVYDFRTFCAYRKILKKAKAYNPDVYYTSLGTAPFGPTIYRFHWPMKKTVTACHNVSTPKGANQERYNRFHTAWLLRAFKNIQVFSESQRDILLLNYPNKNVLLAPLAIKDYGEPSIPVKPFDENKVVFLFFGIISPYKRLDLLIEAAQDLYEKGYKNFKVKIAGNCKTWPEYEALIRYPELFDIRIAHIPNAEVADLFAGCDYFVMPYQDIAQSGAITVAFRYNLPVILSDLPQFKPYCIDGETGCFFESSNAKNLEDKMLEVINGGKPTHDKLCKGLTDFVKERYSTAAIVKKYKDFFEGL